MTTAPLRLVLDANYLCHRAYHTPGRGQLRYGVVFGFLQDLRTLMREFRTNDVVFCWDCGKPVRQELFLPYKANRKPNPEVIEQAAMIDGLLDRVGFKNNFAKVGYEADDVIAAVVKIVDAKELEVGQVLNTIVSADQDLWQLLENGRVEIWNPTQKRLMTEKLFREKYGLWPEFWPEVKAIAGCNSDNIKGVPGIGQGTAIKYINNPASVSKSARTKIENFLWNPLLQLTRLPFEGLGKPKIRKDQFDPDLWNHECRKLGLTSLIDAMQGVIP